QHGCETRFFAQRVIYRVKIQPVSTTVHILLEHLLYHIERLLFLTHLGINALQGPAVFLRYLGPFVRRFSLKSKLEHLQPIAMWPSSAVSLANFIETLVGPRFLNAGKNRVLLEFSKRFPVFTFGFERLSYPKVRQREVWIQLQGLTESHNRLAVLAGRNERKPGCCGVQTRSWVEFCG